RVAGKALATMKEKVRTLTRRTVGRSLEQVCDELRVYLLGWKQYFRLADTPGVFEDLDKWIRHRLRAIQLKQWRRGTTIFRELRASEQLRRLTGSPPVGRITSTLRTARCGPACRVVWQGSLEIIRGPYADSASEHDAFATPKPFQDEKEHAAIDSRRNPNKHQV